MTDRKVWLVTGAGRGMGVDLAKAALAAGHAVVATGRNTDTVKKALVEPGFFRTELLEPASTTFAERSIDDYAARRAENRAWWESMNGKQEGDPAKLAAALVQIVDQDNPPVRWVAGADAVAAVEQKARDLLAQVDAHRDISTSLAIA